MSDVEGEDLSASIKPTFVKRSRPRGAARTAASSSSTLNADAPSSKSNGPSANKKSPQLSKEHVQDDEDEDSPSGVIRRHAGSRGPGRSHRLGTLAQGESNTRKKGEGSKIKKATTTSSAALKSYGTHDDAEEPLFEINSSAKASSSKLGLPTNLDQANLAATTHTLPHSAENHYSAANLAALKASTPSSRIRQGVADDSVFDEDGNLIPMHETLNNEDEASAAGLSSGVAYQTLADPMMQGDTSLRFGAGYLQEEEGQVPSESVIEAAKERRRRAAAGTSIEQDGHEDFIALDDSKGRDLARYDASMASRSNYSESALQREEDEYGSGEEEFANFTGAQERIALESKDRKRQEARQRRERAEMMQGDGNGLLESGSGAVSEDDSGDEYEQVQLGRMSMPGDRQRREKREKSPYRPESLPPILPLPVIGEPSRRIAARLEALQESLQMHQRTVETSNHSLSQLEEEEAANKSEVEIAAEKEAWISEFGRFIEALAGLLEEKNPILQEVEQDWTRLLAQRTRLLQRKRAKDIEDDLSLWWGVSSYSILPPGTRGAVGDSEDAMNLDATDENHHVQEESPTIDGDAQSLIRQERRSHRSKGSNTIDILSDADQASFEQAATPIEQRLSTLMADVRAPEFSHPDAVVEGTGSEEALIRHPSSVYNRFLEWRRRYPSDFNGAWGGLAYAGVWEFWTRKELALWDPFYSQGQDLESSGPLQALHQWTEDSLEEQEGQPQGGDDEAPTALVNNVFVSRLLQLTERGCYDPWSSQQSTKAIRIVRQVADFSDKNALRFQSLISAFLKVLESHIDRLAFVVGTSAAIAIPPPVMPSASSSKENFLRQVIGPSNSLLFNLIKWSPFITSMESKTLFSRLIDTLLGDVTLSVLGAGEEGIGRDKERTLVDEVLRSLPATAPLQDGIKQRLAGYVQRSKI
ncbi:unnamed protein product [Sympodiomycopsis kandeliae]